MKRRIALCSAPPRRISAFLGRTFTAIIVLFAFAACPNFAAAQSRTFKIPPVNVPLRIKDQDLTVVASGLITLLRKNGGENLLNLELNADLSDLQQNLTPLLSSELDKDDRCGDRIQIRDATIVPIEPSSLAVVHLHFERWACAKLFGKQQTKRLIGGNAVVQMKLIPAVGENHTELRLLAELGSIEADGSLGELLRTGNFGVLLRDKIQTAILSKVQKGLDLATILPPVLQGCVTIQDARFRDGGCGRLLAVLDGQIQITDEQLRTLSKQLKNRLPVR